MSELSRWTGTPGRISVLPIGVVGYPWVVVCPCCPRDSVCDPWTGINSPIGCATQFGAMTRATRHVELHALANSPAMQDRIQKITSFMDRVLGGRS